MLKQEETRANPEVKGSINEPDFDIVPPPFDVVTEGYNPAFVKENNSRGKEE